MASATFYIFTRYLHEHFNIEPWKIGKKMFLVFQAHIFRMLWATQCLFQQ